MLGGDSKSAEGNLVGVRPPSRHQDKLHKMNRLQGPKPLDPRGFFVPKSAGDTSGDTLLFCFRRVSYGEEAGTNQGSLGARAWK
jgi:hypothetical protein